ncbi:hypothetical protein LCGC14_0667150 [marine sediment metagenome]|uniref:Uncharacterized protein n=1 Tax=marine sediment metagenome TaxID=412755 RepID=A0A0F9U058_9ZZZZ
MTKQEKLREYLSKALGSCASDIRTDDAVAFITKLFKVDETKIRSLLAKHYGQVYYYTDANDYIKIENKDVAKGIADDINGDK